MSALFSHRGSRTVVSLFSTASMFVSRKVFPGGITTCLDRTGKNGEIGIATKLGCAVEHACLAAYYQCAHSVRADRRKDFEYLVRVQASHQDRGKFARAAPIQSSVRPGTVDTTPPIPLPQVLRVGSLRQSTLLVRYLHSGSTSVSRELGSPIESWCLSKSRHQRQHPVHHWHFGTSPAPNRL